jgi:chemotaxis protein CheY-P-specific phosphatase CheC
MLNNLSQTEMEVATNLISGGLTMARSSMEQILRSPIDLERIDYSSDSAEIPYFNTKKGSKLHLIKTELKGQLTGSCFLVLSDEEVNKINESCLPAELLSDLSEDGESMKMAFLKEIDNMVAAAVVTEFSNILDLELFGDVPHAYLLDESDVMEYLASESVVYKTIIHFKAHFHGKELGISPDFIWMFSDQFVDKIRAIA